MKIFVDFDDVLFYTKTFAHDLMALFEQHGVDRKKFEESYHAFPHRDPEKQIQYLEEKYKVDAQPLRKAFHQFIAEKLNTYVFDDAYEFLKSFDKDDLYLLTFGAKVFQKIKVENSGLEKYFNRIIITQSKKIDRIMQIADEEKFAGDEKIFLIDDHPTQMETQHRGEYNVTCLHLRRPEGRYSKNTCMGCDGEATNLEQVKVLIEKIATP